jgi:hypothetical protein
MSKKDYCAIAAIISRDLAGFEAIRARLALDLGDLFARDNPRFVMDRWLRATREVAGSSAAALQDATRDKRVKVAA